MRLKKVNGQVGENKELFFCRLVSLYKGEENFLDGESYLTATYTTEKAAKRAAEAAAVCLNWQIEWKGGCAE